MINPDWAVALGLMFFFQLGVATAVGDEVPNDLNLTNAEEIRDAKK